MSGRQYNRAKYIAENATPEIIEELDKGKRSISRTYDELSKKEETGKSTETAETETIGVNSKSDVDHENSGKPEDGRLNTQPVEPPKINTPPAGLLSKADEEALERNKAFNALSPQKKVIELQRQLKEERVRATRAESELALLKELRHNDVFHKDGIINNLRERLTDAEARIKELEDLYCPN
jgi:hypothetical protein